MSIWEAAAQKVPRLIEVVQFMGSCSCPFLLLLLLPITHRGVRSTGRPLRRRSASEVALLISYGMLCGAHLGAVRISWYKTPDTTVYLSAW